MKGRVFIEYVPCAKYWAGRFICEGSFTEGIINKKNL
jgi:hypothetical protein